MKLLFNSASPFARKVRILIKEKRLEDKIELEVAQPWPEPTAITPFNPLGKIPVLILDDGFALNDSPVICEYIDSLNGNAPSLPPPGPARWTVLRAQALADGMLDAAVNIVLERKRPAAEQSAMMTARHVNAIRRTLQDAAGALNVSDVAFNLGQIGLACVLGYLEFRLPDLDLAGDDRLQAWWSTVKKRPSITSTDPKLA